MSRSFHQTIAIGKALDEFVPGQLVDINIPPDSLRLANLSVSSQSQANTRTCNIPCSNLPALYRRFFEFNRIEFRVDLMIGKRRSASGLVKLRFYQIKAPGDM